MYDTSVEMIGLRMNLASLGEPADAQVPARYGWRFYRPGDEAHWARMWVSAGGFSDEAAALKMFEADFPQKDALGERMLFLTDNGVPFATAAVWFGDGPSEGRLHWVCIDGVHQRQGLCRVLIELALQRCRELGCTSAWLLTNTPSWVAIRMYHRFGFRAALRGGEDERGWQIVSEKTGIDFLNEEGVVHV